MPDLTLDKQLNRRQSVMKSGADTLGIGKIKREMEINEETNRLTKEWKQLSSNRGSFHCHYGARDRIHIISE